MNSTTPSSLTPRALSSMNIDELVSSGIRETQLAIECRRGGAKQREKHERRAREFLRVALDRGQNQHLRFHLQAVLARLGEHAEPAAHFRGGQHVALVVGGGGPTASAGAGGAPGAGGGLLLTTQHELHLHREGRAPAEQAALEEVDLETNSSDGEASVGYEELRNRYKGLLHHAESDAESENGGADQSLVASSANSRERESPMTPAANAALGISWDHVSASNSNSPTSAGMMQHVGGAASSSRAGAARIAIGAGSGGSGPGPVGGAAGGTGVTSATATTTTSSATSGATSGSAAAATAIATSGGGVNLFLIQELKKLQAELEKQKLERQDEKHQYERKLTRAQSVAEQLHERLKGTKYGAGGSGEKSATSFFAFLASLDRSTFNIRSSSICIQCPASASERCLPPCAAARVPRLEVLPPIIRGVQVEGCARAWPCFSPKAGRQPPGFAVANSSSNTGTSSGGGQTGAMVNQSGALASTTQARSTSFTYWTSAATHTSDAASRNCDGYERTPDVRMVEEIFSEDRGNPVLTLSTGLSVPPSELPCAAPKIRLKRMEPSTVDVLQLGKSGKSTMRVSLEASGKGVARFLLAPPAAGGSASDHRSLEKKAQQDGSSSSPGAGAGPLEGTGSAAGLSRCQIAFTDQWSGQTTYTDIVSCRATVGGGGGSATASSSASAYSATSGVLPAPGASSTASTSSGGGGGGPMLVEFHIPPQLLRLCRETRSSMLLDVHLVVEDGKARAENRRALSLVLGSLESDNSSVNSS
eukprot:g17918.t1